MMVDSLPRLPNETSGITLLSRACKSPLDCPHCHMPPHFLRESNWLLLLLLFCFIQMPTTIFYLANRQGLEYSFLYGSANL